MTESISSQEIKPGYKTTEFWLILLGNIILALVTFLETLDASWAAIAITVLNSIYALSRMGVKATVAKAKEATPTLLLIFAFGLLFTSCTPTSYSVDTSHYTEQIAENPNQVTMNPEHVTPVGIMKPDITTSIFTEYGEFELRGSELRGGISVDLTSGK